MPSSLLGAIEAGGTKFICAVARAVDDVLQETSIPTTTPAETLAAVIEFFASAEKSQGRVHAVGIASFGPVDLKRSSATWGHILDTPKAGWQLADMAGPIKQRFGCPVAIDTDVNAAALAEALYGAGRGCDSVAYVTVGTGVGGGAVINGQTLLGALHPEMGHIRVVRDPRDMSFEGLCPFHGDCLEGMACGPAIRARWGAPLDQLPAEHEAYGVIGNYLGQLAATLILVLSSERIVFGGGVMQNRLLLPHIHRSAQRMLNGYLMQDGLESFERRIVAPGLGNRSGLTGALALAASLGERGGAPA